MKTKLKTTIKQLVISLIFLIALTISLYLFSRYTEIFIFIVVSIATYFILNSISELIGFIKIRKARNKKDLI